MNTSEDIFIFLDMRNANLFKCLCMGCTLLCHSLVDAHAIVFENPPENFALNSLSVTQQSRKITGFVKDENGIPIIGANVVEKGTTNGVITGMDGDFTLQVSENAVIEISYIGYLSQ